MAKPVDPFGNGPNGGERDPQGRFKRGAWKGGPGARMHRYVKQRGALQAAMVAEISPGELRQLVRKLYGLAMAGDVKAGALIIAYTCGRAPEAVSSLQLNAPERIARMPALSIEDVAQGLQRTLEEYQGGRLGAEEVRMSQALLGALLQARQAGDLDRKVSELLAILKEGADNAQPA